ncbi:MAG: nitrate/nitrite transporter NrtS [Dongiaceae bacterium]
MRRAEFVGLALGGGALRRSLITGAIVGSILSGINQGDIIATGGPMPWVKIVLNYIVPFCVATYGAFSSRLAARDSQA